ncbi:MAG: hypothetical protein Q9214_000501 [Letrouitia sp. 1 TL-2023]
MEKGVGSTFTSRGQSLTSYSYTLSSDGVLSECGEDWVAYTIMESSFENTPSGQPPVLRGSCACGKCTYNSATLPTSITLCYCTTCRKISGAPFLPFGNFDNSAVRWTDETQKTMENPRSIKDVGGRLHPPMSLQRSPIAYRGACSDCSSPLFMKYHCEPSMISIPMGTMDDASVVGKLPVLSQHIFLSEKATWWDAPSDDKAARYETFSDGFEDQLREWIAVGRPQIPKNDFLNLGTKD